MKVYHTSVSVKGEVFVAPIIVPDVVPALGVMVAAFAHKSFEAEEPGVNR